MFCHFAITFIVFVYFFKLTKVSTFKQKQKVDNFVYHKTLRHCDRKLRIICYEKT